MRLLVVMTLIVAKTKQTSGNLKLSALIFLKMAPEKNVHQQTDPPSTVLSRMDQNL